MPIETVMVQYVNQPKEGKKQGSIKTDDGRYFGVWPEKLCLYTPGEFYEIEYDAQYKTVKRIVTGPGASGSASSAPRANGQAQSHSPSHTKSVEMFVMGVIGRTLQGTGDVPSAAVLTQWVRSLRLAWADGFAASAASATSATSATKNELNDEIPF